MSREVTAAISEIHACALRVRVAQRLDRAEVARLATARAVLADDHVVAGAVDYFLLVCADDCDAVISHAQRLRDVVLSCPRSAGRADLGQIYG